MGIQASGATGFSAAAVLMVCPGDWAADFFFVASGRAGGLSHDRDRAAIGRASGRDAGLT
jgi:hypothetical protein